MTPSDCLKLVCFLPQPEAKDPEEGRSINVVIPTSSVPAVDTPTPAPTQPSQPVQPPLPNVPAVAPLATGVVAAAAQ